MKSVPKDEWQIDPTVDSQRKSLLLSEVSPDELLERVYDEAMAAADKGEVSLCWEPCQRRTGFFRAASTIRLREATFDLLLNGRMGYRGQYYLSLAAGREFNRKLVDLLSGPIERAFKVVGSRLDCELVDVQRSLREKDSKVWAYLDKDAFQGQPGLTTPMWVANCKATQAKLGLHLAALNPPKIEIKGTWVTKDREAMPLAEYGESTSGLPGVMGPNLPPLYQRPLWRPAARIISRQNSKGASADQSWRKWPLRSMVFMCRSNGGRP